MAALKHCGSVPQARAEAPEHLFSPGMDEAPGEHSHTQIGQ